MTDFTPKIRVEPIFLSLGRIAGLLWVGFAFHVNVTYPYLSSAGVMFAGFLIRLAQVTSRSPSASVTPGE